MEETIIKLGLTAKEAKLYLLLLEQPHQTAADVATAAREKRTNVYMLLDSLAEKGLAEVSDKAAVREYSATDPTALNKLLQAEQERQRQASVALNTAMPRLKSLYSLANDKPGVVHMAGNEGLLRLLDDMARSDTELLLVASNDLPADAETLRQFWNRIIRRRDNGIATRALFHHGSNDQLHQREFTERGMELRFLGDKSFKSEFAIYENNVSFTVYDPTLITTVVTNSAIADTMRTLFEELWEKAA